MRLHYLHRVVEAQKHVESLKKGKWGIKGICCVECCSQDESGYKSCRDLDAKNINFCYMNSTVEALPF